MKHKPKNKSPSISARKQKHMGEIFSEVLILLKLSSSIQILCLVSSTHNQLYNGNTQCWFPCCV